MAYRRHILAVRNTSPNELGRELSEVQISAIEEANGWCWATASVWNVDSGTLLNALETFDGPALLVTTEDGCRWRLHLRKSDREPFSTAHEFGWVSDGEYNGEGEDEWHDVYDEDDDTTDLEECVVPSLPERRLTPLDFEDEFFQPYDDDFDEEEEEDLSPFEELEREFSGYGLSLPDSICDALRDLPASTLYPRFLELHGAYIAQQLKNFDIPSESQEVCRILTGANVTAAEMESDVGNLWRFLSHLGLGEKFSTALQEMTENDRESEVESTDDPAAEVIEAAGSMPLHPIVDGTFSMPVTEAPLMLYIANALGSRPEVAIHATCDPKQGTWSPRRPPAYMAIHQDDSGAKCSFNNFDPIKAPKSRKRIGSLLATLPDGSRLELLSKGEYTHLRLAGSVSGGEWHVEGASAALSALELEELLNLFRACEAGKPQTTRDASEADTIMDMASHDLILFEDMPTRSGTNLVTRTRDEAHALAALFFRHRFKHCWDLSNLETDDQRGFDAWAMVEQLIDSENTLPVTEEVVLDGKSSKFIAPDFKSPSIDKGMRTVIKKNERSDKDFTALGFQYLGDIVCVKAGGAVMRCYANAAENAYGVAYAAPLGMGWRDFVTQFTDDTWLTTTSSMMESSIRTLRYLVRTTNTKSIKTLYEEHREGIGRLEARGMVPAPIEPTLPGIASAMDAFLVRRLGDGDTDE